MGFLTIVIALELVITASIAGLSSHPQTLTQTKHKISQVLGIQIAQVKPTPEPTPEPTESPSPTPEDTPKPTTIPSDTPIPSPNTDASPTPSLGVGENLFPQPTNGPISDQFNLSPITDTNTVQTESILNPSDLVNSTDNINSQSVDEAKKEDAQIAQTTNPQDQTNLLIGFATDKIKDLNNFTKSDDFSSVNFAALRFNSQIEKAISNLDKLLPTQQTKLKARLINFCDQADAILRTVQLSVPEESEPDLEMARGQCQELQP